MNHFMIYFTGGFPPFVRMSYVCNLTAQLLTEVFFVVSLKLCLQPAGDHEDALMQMLKKHMVFGFDNRICF